jgi:PAS domain S-box-containing protein
MPISRFIGFPPAYRYGIALTLFLIALAVRLGVAPVEDGLPFFTFFPAVALAVVLCGLGPSLLVLLLGGVVGQYVFMPPFWSFKSPLDELPVLATFYISELIICLVVNEMHKTRAAMAVAVKNATMARHASEVAKDNAEEILSSIADGFYALDREWRFRYINRRAEEILGKRRSEVIGKPFFSVFPQVEHSQVHENYKQVMAGRQPLEFEFISPILKRWTSFSVYPSGDGGISVYFRDISAQKASEAELIATKAEAGRANLAKSKFLAAASHDLRQPVQSLVLLLEVLKLNVTTPPVAKAVGLMENALEGLNGLLTSILDVSRIDAGVVTPQLGSIDVGAIVHRLCIEYTPLCEQKGLRLRRVCKPSLHARTDAVLLERIMRNLFENAIRYTHQGGLLIGTRRRGDQLRIDVVDTGIGIPDDKLTHVFEEFYQVANPARDRNQGLGLGLAIVSRLARLIGADVQVRSHEGRGTCFTLLLPIDAATHQVSSKSATDDVVSGQRIMVIEDDPTIRMGLQLMLEGWNCEVVAAESCEVAIELAESVGWGIDAIIADHRLGTGLTGTETAAEILRRSGQPIPTIIVTGDTAPERIEEVHGSGFEIMHKPVAPDALARKLAQLLRGGVEGNGDTELASEAG